MDYFDLAVLDLCVAHITMKRCFALLGTISQLTTGQIFYRCQSRIFFGFRIGSAAGLLFVLINIMALTPVSPCHLLASLRLSHVLVTKTNSLSTA